MKKNIFLLIVLLGLIPQYLSAQKAPKKITISGIVTDVNNRPVSGAIILLDNKKTEVITDSRGAYRIKIKPEVKTITAFSLMSGMKDEQVNNRTEINFTLPGSGARENAPDVGKEATVNVGYGSVDRKDLTNPVGQIDGQNPKYLSYTNIYDMIRGEVAGVQVTGKKITIQGVSSINSGTDPLLVVNGVVVSSIDDISPYTVKSIEILKGSAASIYGSRGANGVILINLVGAEKKK